MANVNVNDELSGGGLVLYSSLQDTPAVTEDAVVTGACKIHWVMVFADTGTETTIHIADSLTAPAIDVGEVRVGAPGANNTRVLDLTDHPYQFNTGLSLRITTTTGGNPGAYACIFYSID
jgi:hypothetical protein